MWTPLLRRSTRFASLLAIGALGLATSDSGTAQRDAESFQRKLLAIYQNGHRTDATAQRTPIDEGEVNAYFKVYAAGQLPTGVVDPQIAILGDGRVAGRATVDLEAIKRQKPDSWAGALSLLAGNTLPVAATGLLRTKDGVGQLELERVEISGLPVPTTVLQELVSYYSRTPDHPDGVRLNDPFKLPAGIKEIQIEKGRAVIVQ